MLNPRQTSCGDIQVIIGPMFSEKSTELLRRVRRYTRANRRCLVIKHASDTRYDTSAKDAGDDSKKNDEMCPGVFLTTHDGMKWSATAASDLKWVRAVVDSYDVIAIDEGQWFPDICWIADDLADSGKIVIVAALNCSFQREPFPGGMMELIAIAEKVDKMMAVCYFCKKDASFSLRLGQETELQVVGGEDNYRATCRTCYYREHAFKVRSLETTTKRPSFADLMDRLDADEAWKTPRG